MSDNQLQHYHTDAFDHTHQAVMASASLSGTALPTTAVHPPLQQPSPTCDHPEGQLSMHSHARLDVFLQQTEPWTGAAKTVM